MKQYSPLLSLKAEELYFQGNYSECVKLALEAYSKAKNDCEQEWNEMLKGPPTELAKLTVMWDTTTQKSLRYDEYLQVHNWEDDIPPGPLRIAVKSLRKQTKIAMKNNDPEVALNYFKEIEKIGEFTKSDRKMIAKLLNKKF